MSDHLLSPPFFGKNINNDTLKCYNDRSVRLRILSVNVKTYRGLVFHSAVVRVLRDLTVVLWDASSTGIFGTTTEGRPSCLLLVVSLRNANRGLADPGLSAKYRKLSLHLPLPPPLPLRLPPLTLKKRLRRMLLEVLPLASGWKVSTLHGMGVSSAVDPSLDLGGDDFIQDALHGMGVGSAADPSVATPMPDILGDDSSESKGKDIGGGGGARPPSNTKVSSVSYCILQTFRCWRS
jgi:hypothetical protein